jgi:hypothetical protein
LEFVVAARVLVYLSRDAVAAPKIEDDTGVVAFFKSERSIVRLRTVGDGAVTEVFTTDGSRRRLLASDTSRMGMRIEYNVRRTEAVDALISQLLSLGFREIDRFPPMP